MKKIICITWLAICSIANAQNTLPKTATDISPLLIGEKVPDAALQLPNGKNAAFPGLLTKKKTILVFYRGGWCPYCNAHLSALGEAEKELLELGYQIIAISPDSPENLKNTQEKDKLNYLLLSDSKGELAGAVGIIYEAPQNYKDLVKENSKGINTRFLPVPSVFIVNTVGEIQFEYIAPDFKNRISTELLLAAAKNLK